METLKLLTDAVLQLLAGYLEFALDLFSLQGLALYARSNRINTRLLSYFIVGSAVAYFLTKGRMFPGLSSHSTPEETPEERQAADQMIFGLMIAKVFAFALASHVILLVASNKMGLAHLGSARDSLNAWLASAAVMFPVCVLSRRLNNTARLFIQNTNSATKGELALGVVLSVLSSLINLLVFVYYGLVLTRIHDVKPIVGFFPGIVGLSLLYGGLAFVWICNKISRARRRVKLRQMLDDEESRFRLRPASSHPRPRESLRLGSRERRPEARRRGCINRVALAGDQDSHRGR